VYNNYQFNDFRTARDKINRGDYRGAYETLNYINNRNAEWNYLMGLCSMNLGYYEQGEDYVKRAHFMEPNNVEYTTMFNNLKNTHRAYRSRSHNYHRSRRSNYNDLACCCCADSCCDCCCCPGDDCCDTCGKLYCLDCLCESCGGDFIECC